MNMCVIFFSSTRSYDTKGSGSKMEMHGTQQKKRKKCTEENMGEEQNQKWDPSREPLAKFFKLFGNVAVLMQI
jgi:hypothetical protein